MKRLLACSALFAVSPLLAATSRVAVTAGARDFLAGEAKGTAVSADGRLTIAPPLAPRTWPENAADAAVFAAAGDASGRVYLATGGGLGRLFVSDPKGVTLVFAAPEPNITAVAIAPDGAVVCASSPNGKIYRVNPKESDPEKAGTVLGDPKEAAVWSLAFGPDGTLYAGTGNKGRIYRKTPAGALELFHEIEDVHVRTLLAGPDGTLYAGTSDRGLVVAIGAKGARTLYDFSRPEVTGLALDGRGVLYAAASQVDASVGRAVPIEIRSRPTPTPTPSPGPAPEAPKGTVSIAATTSAVRPVVAPQAANSSEIAAIAPDGFVEPAWTFPEEAVFSLRFDASSGSLIIATGPRGRLYAWKDREVRLLAQTGEKLVVAAPAAGAGFAAVTNGAAGILRPAGAPAPASYVSAVKDAARLSTFGHARWEGAAPAGSAVSLSVRAGNSEKPDATWSAWTPTGAGGGAKLPAARFFQWKADLTPNGKGESPSVERVEITYTERNARPVLENLTVLEPGLVFARGGSAGSGVLSVTNPDENGIFAGLEQPHDGSSLEGPGRRLWRKGFRTLTWKGLDPNGDSLRYDVEARREGGSWFPVRKDVEDSFLSFDTTALADGRYRFRVTASDRVSQPEGEALSSVEESALAVVDNTPPVLKVESRRLEGDFRRAPDPRHRRALARRARRGLPERRPLAAPARRGRRGRLARRALRLPRPEASRSLRPRGARRRRGRQRRGRLGRMAVLTSKGGTRRRVPPAAHPLRAAGYAALVGLCFVVSACGTHGKDQTSVIRRRLDGEPKTLNPILTTTDAEQIVVALLSRNLLDYDEKLNLVPGLAEEVSDSPDHLVFTVRLRPDARWEDGTPVTSADVVFTLNAIMDPKVPALARRPLFEGLVKAEAVDPRTARVTFRTASAGRRDAFNLPLLSAAAWRDGDVATHPRNRHPLADGPYRLGAWEAGRTISLVRNTQYAGPAAPAEQVVFRVVPETAPAFAGLLSGDLDEMRLTFAQKREIDAQAGTPGAPRAVTFDDLAYAYFGWNNRSPLFSDRRVRRALTMLVDRESIDRNLYGGLAKLANGPLPPAHWAWNSSIASLAVRSEGGRGPSRRGRLSQGPGRDPPQGRPEARVHVLLRHGQRRAAADGRAGPAVLPQGGDRHADPAARVGDVHREGGRRGARGVGRGAQPRPVPGPRASPGTRRRSPRTVSTTASTGTRRSMLFSNASGRSSTARRPGSCSARSSGSSTRTSPSRS